MSVCVCVCVYVLLSPPGYTGADGRLIKDYYLLSLWTTSNTLSPARTHRLTHTHTTRGPVTGGYTCHTYDVQIVQNHSTLYRLGLLFYSVGMDYLFKV